MFLPFLLGFFDPFRSILVRDGCFGSVFLRDRVGGLFLLCLLYPAGFLPAFLVCLLASAFKLALGLPDALCILICILQLADRAGPRGFFSYILQPADNSILRLCL